MKDDVGHPGLVDAAKRGDRAAFDTLIDSLRGRVRGLIATRLARRYVLHVEVDDVFQEVVLRAFRALDAFQWRSEDALVRWLGGFVENVISEQARRYARARQVPLDGELPASSVSPSRAQGRRERFDRLRAAVDRLSPEHREVILLTRLEGLKFRDVGRKMGRSPDAVKQLFYRALRQLRTLIPETESLRLDGRSLREEDER